MDDKEENKDTNETEENEISGTKIVNFIGPIVIFWVNKL
jgi:hypothetical protein